MAAPSLHVSVQDNLKSAVARLEVRSRKLVDDAAVRALNRTAGTVRTHAVREIRKRYRIAAGVVRGQMRIVRANRGRLTAEVIATGRRIPLIHFSARQTAKGVTVRVTAERKLVRHAFIATMPGGHTGVFARKGRERLPIKEIFSLSLPQAFTQKQIIESLKAIARERFNIEFTRELKFRAGL